MSAFPQRRARPGELAKRPEVYIPKRALQMAGFRALSNAHWQMWLNGKSLDYWPKQRKWQYGAEVEEGPLEDLLAAVDSLRRIARAGA